MPAGSIDRPRNGRKKAKPGNVFTLQERRLFATGPSGRKHERMLTTTLLLCPWCHSTRLVLLTYTEPAVEGTRGLPETRPSAKCVACGRALLARDVLVRMLPRSD